MHPFNLILALLGALILGLGLGSKRLAEVSLPPTLIALVIGALLGPAVLGVLDLAALGEEALIREKIGRLTLGIGLVGVALRIPRTFGPRHWRDLVVLIGLGMPLMWLISSSLVWAILGLPIWMAALIGALVTPTDPVAATPIVTGKIAEEHLPERLRHTISFESGANDGLGYLLVFLPTLMLTRPPAEAVTHWLSHTLLWDLASATVLGLLLGYGAGRLLELAEDRGTIEREWRLIYTVALALTAIGVGRLIGSDEVLVAFAAGVAFVRRVTAEERETEDLGQEAINRFFAVPVFAVIGLTLPWAGWADLGWRGSVLAAAIILLRRPPVMLLLRPLLHVVRNGREALFVGWFGPIAVAAMYYASLVEHRLGDPLPWHVVSLVICASTLVHGSTAAPITRAMPAPAGESNDSS